MLNAFKFEQLESELAKLQKKNLSSDGGDLLTLRDLVDLQRMGSRSESLVRMWVDQRPQSFFRKCLRECFMRTKRKWHGEAVMPEAYDQSNGKT